MLLSRLPLPSIKRALRVRSISKRFLTNELTPALKRPPRNPPSSLEGGALDLHVLGLPPAFALSQDQTLKLDENFSRLITTFDEVPLLFVRAQACPRPQPRSRLSPHDKGVDLKRRPPKVSSGRISVGNKLLSKPNLRPGDRGPQGLRRPRFSFFRFTCQTARDQGGPRAPVRRKAVAAHGLR